VKDVLSMDFSSINADWANNYASIFNSSQAAKDYGNSMDAATSAANAQDAAQKALNKSVNANTMSFDQLHNITNSGAVGAQGQTDAVNNLADALTNLKTKSMDNITNTESKGIVIPVSFKIPPIPPIPPPPPVVFPAVDNVTPVVETIKTELASLPGKVTVPIGVDDQTEPAYGNVRNKLDTFTPKLINVPVSVLGEALLTSTLLSMQNKLTGWQTAAVTCFNAVTQTELAWEASAAGVFSSVQTYIQSWEAGTVSSFAQFQSSVATDFNAAGSSIHTWSVDASQDFDEFTANAGSCISTFMNNLHNDLNQVFTSTETMAVSWANSIGETITKALNQAIDTMSKLAAITGTVIPSVSQSIWQSVSGAYTGVANWVENNKSWLVPLGVAAGAVGVTIATGGADLLAGGAAAAGSALAGTVSNIGSAIPAFASGGIVTSATLGVFGEAGPEAVIPLAQLDSMLSGASKSSGGSSQSTSAQPINVTLKLDGRTLARTLYQYTVNENDRQGTTIGYNSSYNLPK
ncbi:MAG: hypothetical protein P4L69_18545, partial [Desulfosporosinus sp.]|nr:hypothetical protein [Desulfosporosinus sp.]